MMDITQIIATQTDTLAKMKAKSVLALSDSPSADGVSANMIKESFVRPLWEGDDSIIGEIKRVCGQINKAFAAVKTAIEANEAEIQTTITSNKASIDAAKTELQDSISGVQATVEADMNKSIANINTEIGRIQANMNTSKTELQTSIDSVQRTLTGSVEANKANADAEIASLQAKVAANEGQIQAIKEGYAQKGDAIQFRYSAGRLDIVRGQ